MEKRAIVSLSDSNYFNLLIDLVDSINSFPESKNIKICILDAGLKTEQIEILKKKVHSIKKAEWDIDIPFHKRAGREWLKSQVSRAFLPKYFPNFEKFLWIDCDAWVNSWTCIEDYFKACENNKLGITQTIGPGYKILAKVKWIFGKYAEIKSQNYKHAKLSGIPEKKARQLAFAPHLNIGVFSLENKSSCWQTWQENLNQTLAKGKIFGSEGLAINISVYLDNAPTEFLPLSYNWIASNLLPIYDEEKKTFREPYIPNNEIGIMHLAGGIWNNGIDMRVDKKVKIKVKSLSGEVLEKSLRYQKKN